MREVADVRVHGTTGEVPMVRFEREERQALRPLNGRPPFRQMRELTRRVQNDACVDVDTNHYSVPWRLIGVQTANNSWTRPLIAGLKRVTACRSWCPRACDLVGRCLSRISRSMASRTMADCGGCAGWIAARSRRLRGPS